MATFDNKGQIINDRLSFSDRFTAIQAACDKMKHEHEIKRQQMMARHQAFEREFEETKRKIDEITRHMEG